MSNEPADVSQEQPSLHVFLNMHAFCHPEAAHQNTTEEFRRQMTSMKATFVVAQIVCCVIGITGNVLNLRTLQSPSLQTVPFMYIRALAVFDMISLSGILIHFTVADQTHTYFFMFYLTYLEAPLINTFLVAGLYCAFMLTLERYQLISSPHSKPSADPHRLAAKKIMMALFWAVILHLPMMLQTKLRHTYDAQLNETTYSITNNVEMLCREPHWTLYNYYKMLRECIRFLCVVVMTILNVIIARKLQITKMRRRRLVRRSSPSDMSPSQQNLQRTSSPDTPNHTPKREISSHVRSFTEKKLTGLMLAICVIFILGNVPQMIVMVLQNESMDNVFGFQLYRNVANLLEVVNHCLNFYVFCMASSEYTRAFLLNCVCMRSILLRIPRIADFLAARRSSSMVSGNASGIVMENQDYCSMEYINEPAPQWDDEAGSSSVHPKDSSSASDSQTGRLKGILVSSVRAERNRERKSLTIVNHLAVPLDSDYEETEEV